MATELASSPGLGALPNELVMNIIDFIPIENARDIRNLSLTSWRMYRLSLNHLYHHILVSSPWPLVRTLLHDPKLAARVQQVTWNQKTPEICSEDDRKKLITVMRSFQQVEEKFSMDRLRACNTWHDHNYMSFFITVTPAMETLIIKDTYDWRTNSYWFRQAVEEAGTLQHLRSVYIHGPLCLEQIAHLLLVPSLRNLTIVEVVERESLDYRYLEWNRDLTLHKVLQPDISLVENITLKRAFVDMQALACFTTACKHLKSFAYEHDVHNDLRTTRVYNPLSIFERLDETLRHNRASLERLSLRSDHSMMSQRSVLQVAELASKIPNLRSLDMGLITHDDDPDYSMDGFVDRFVSHLPPKLEELTFEMDWQEHWGLKGWEGPTDMLCCLAQAAPPRLPLLKRVAVVDWPPKLGLFPPDFAILHRRFAEHNVHFASIPVHIEAPDHLRISEFVEPGWIFVDVADVERNTGEETLDVI